jgi:hypothetical protein
MDPPSVDAFGSFSGALGRIGVQLTRKKQPATQMM